MSSNWPLKKISDVAYFRNNKRIPLKSLDRAKRQGEFPYYGASGIVDYIDDYVFDGSYLLISEDGENLRTRKTPIAFQAHGKFWVNNHAHILEEKEEGILDYLEYYFSTLDLTPYITGAVQPKLNKANLDTIEIPIPPKDERRSINRTLNHLRDKIELNTQTNQTLEQMAQAIFKSWFVDFDPVKAKIEALAAGGNADDAELAAMSVISAKTVDELNSLKASNPEAFNKLAQTAALFPAAMQDSELGEIPEGWEVKSLGEFTSTFDYVANGSFAALKANVKLFDEPNDVLYVRTTDFNKGFKSELKYTDNSSYQFLAKSKLFGHETIISNVGDVGTVFRAPSWYGMPMTLGSNAMGIVAEGANSYIYYLFKSPLGQHLLDGITSGSAQMKFNKTSFRKLRVVLPNSVLLIKFEEFEASLWTKHTSNQKESLHLENLRDSLLPKLLSGEIDLTSEVVE
ncbi:restriction endonuclease subunit S [Vibrio cholerae]|nr:restriction endonuclease subunit S [Vibrio cholerae]EKF9445119.1 restriction endonuclease subunit S [Vibrio cholerae]ELM0315560.1 restriction endonuclease subunit S [Vibrio cholerae]